MKLLEEILYNLLYSSELEKQKNSLHGNNAIIKQKK